MQVGIFYDNFATAFPEASDPCALLRKARDCGVQYLEADLNFLLKQDENFFVKAAECGVGISVYAFVDENCVLGDGRKAEDLLGFLHEHGVPALMLVCASRIDENADKAELKHHIVRSVNRLCEKAADYGMDVLFEDFDSTRIPCGSCADLLEYGSEIKKLKYTFDTGNFSFFGEDPMICFEKMKDRIGHVHVKDRVSPTDLRVPVTGEGGLPLRELLGKIVGTGYDGRFSVEMFGSERNAETISRALDFVRKSVGTAK